MPTPSFTPGFSPSGIKDEAVVREFDALAPAVQLAAQFGTWKSLPFAASNYFATTGTWTVSSDTYRAYYYTAINGWLQVVIYIVGSTTSAGMGSELFIRLPPEYAILPNFGAIGFAAWNTPAATDPPAIVASAPTALVPNCLRLLRDSAATAWPTGTISVGFSVTVPVYLL